MFDAITVGAATLDIFLKSKDYQLRGDELVLAYGGKMNVDELVLQSGGGATNVAVGLARLGLRAAAVIEMGTDVPAKIIIDELKAEGVHLDFMVQEPDEQTAVSALLIGSDGGRSVVTARGAARMLTVDDIPFAKIQAHWLHLSSLGNTELLLAIAKHCHEKRIRLSWNPGNFEIDAMVEGKLHPNEVYPDVLFVNNEEAEKIEKVGNDVTTLAQTVIITAGREGGRYYTRSTGWQSFAPAKTKVVQETGAGDAFAAGVIAAHLHDRPLPAAIEWGTINAASVIQHMGAKTGLKRSLP